jgi:hypothetical protein
MIGTECDKAQQKLITDDIYLRKIHQQPGISPMACNTAQKDQEWEGFEIEEDMETDDGGD